MAYNHISFNADQYNLFLENTNTENDVADDAHSSASGFSILLTPQIDLSSLLYLRSVQAELAISNLVIDNLPLCFTRQEHIDVSVIIPSHIGNVNQTQNATALNNDNTQPLQLRLHDLCCSERQLAIDYINDKLQYSVNHHLVYRYLKLFFDTDIFAIDYMHRLRQPDFVLLNQYINITLACRHVIHQTLCNQLGIVNDDISTRIRYFEPNNSFRANVEEKALSESHCLRPLNQRTTVSTGVRIIDFTLFYSIDITEQAVVQPILKVVKTNFLNWLQELRLLTHNAEGQLKQRNITDMKKMIDSNKALITQGLQARAILIIQQNQSDQQKVRPERDLFNANVVALGLDESGLKCQFHLNQKFFLADDGTTIEIGFPRHMSYVLGSRSGEGISVGPLSATTLPTGTPRITDGNIHHTNQRLPSSICTMPKMIFIATDIVSAQSRDLWLRNTPFADFHMVYSQVIDDQSVGIGMICKYNVDNVFYKIQKLNNVLERFSIKILDQNFQQVLFPLRTYVKIALIIKPAPIESY